ncbi:hypothetical protein AAXE64_08185 [Priestia megaterium]
MKANEFLDQKRKEQKRSMNWLAEELDIPYSTLRSRFKTDTLHIYDMINAARVLHFDLSELKKINYNKR